MAKARRRRIWSGLRDCLARVRRAAASKSGRRGTGAAMALLEQNWPPRNHTQAPRTTPAHESHFRGVGISRWFEQRSGLLGENRGGIWEPEDQEHPLREVATPGVDAVDQ